MVRLAAIAACALLGPAAALRAPGADCVCMNWKEVYQQRRVECGDANELPKGQPKFMAKMFDSSMCRDVPGVSHAFYTSQAPPPATDLCTMVYQAGQHQDHNKCVKVDLRAGPEPSLNPSAWCYVSSRCSDLRGGGKVNAKVSWKTCGAYGDTYLSNVAPKELFDMAKKTGSDPQITALMAFPWRGPARYKGELLSKDVDDAKKAVIGAVPLEDTYKVMHGEQVWLITGAKAECKEGC